MRRFFRLIGFARLLVGAAIVAAAFANQERLGEFWTGILVLAGASVGVAGTASALLLIAYFLVLPFAYIGLIWLLADVWDGSYYSDTLNRYRGILYMFWASGLVALPLVFYYHNKSWFFMTEHFALDEEPTDTPLPELFTSGIVDLTGSQYLASVTITEQGLILDRRNFSPVVLPWQWIQSIGPDEEADPKYPSAVVAMRNDEAEFLTLSVPWNEDLMKLEKDQPESEPGAD